MVVTITKIAFVLIQGYDVSVTHVLRNMISFPIRGIRVRVGASVMTSRGMPSFPGAFLQERWSVALLSSSIVGVVFSSTITGSIGRASRATLDIMFCVVYSSR